MSMDEGVSFSLEVNVGRAEDDVRRLQTALSRTLGLAVRLTGNENLEKVNRVFQEALAWANKLRLAYRALQLARMSAGDPLAWAMAGIAVAEVGVSLYEVTGR